MQPEVHLIAHDIRSRQNVGALFRLADVFGVAKIWCAGYTPIPPDEKIHKTALGAEEWVPWEQEVAIDRLLARLAQEGLPVFALERTAEAQSLPEVAMPPRFALLLGTETTGVPTSLLECVQGVIAIPQVGKKESLNVAMAAGIACYELLVARQYRSKEVR